MEKRNFWCITHVIQMCLNWLNFSVVRTVLMLTGCILFVNTAIGAGTSSSLDVYSNGLSSVFENAKEQLGKKLKGTVINERGEPVPGATVIIKGTTLGSVSDANGAFVIDDVPDGAVIVVTFIGMDSKEIVVGSQTMINVVLKEKAIGVDEVVVIGYGVQRKEDATGALQGLSTEDFNSGVLSSPDQLLTGKVAGLSIISNGGEPGAKSQIRLRGGTSLNAGNEPLFVIDGLPIDNSSMTNRNPLNSINPSDILDVTVLKDASATAIYGSRGANGVIIIRTKRGELGTKGIQEISYSGYSSLSSIDKTYEVLSADEFRDYISSYASNRLPELGDADTDWQDEIYRTAISHSHDLSITGGAEKMGYRLSLGYMSQEGIIKTSGTERLSSAFSLNHLLFDDNLELAANVKLSYTSDDISSSAAVGEALTFDPTQPVKTDSDAFGGYFEYPEQETPYNPVALLKMRQEEAYGLRSLGNIDLSYKLPFFQQVSLKMNLGYDVTSGYQQSFIPAEAKAEAQEDEDNGKLVKNSHYRFNKLLETYVNWNQEFENLNSRFNVVAGYSYQDFSYDYSGFTATNFTSDILGLYSTAPATTFIGNTYKEGNRLISFFGRLNYSFYDRYLLTATVRNDGSSRFSKSNSWGLFPSASLAWRITEENFFKDSSVSDVFSNLKVRMGWGVTGNQEIGNYQYLPTYTLGDSRTMAQFGDEFITTLRPNGVDKDLKWEETSQVNMGIDFGLFKNRISGSVEWYKKNTKDLLFTVSVPQPYLNTQILTNIGEVENVGYEITLETYPVMKKNFNWNMSFNLARNKNQVVNLDDNDDPDFLGYEVGGINGGTGNNILLLRVGEEAYSFYVYEHIMENGQPIYKDMNGDGIINNQDLYRDLNNDGTINEYDKKVKGSIAPDYIVGFSNYMTYNNFDFSFSLKANIGNNVYNNVASLRMATQRITSDNVPRNVLSSTLETGFVQPQYFSDYFVEDASFVRLQNVTLGYTFGLSKTQARLYLTGQNLFVITDYSGIDPENTGIDSDMYPRAKTYMLGLSINF
nr:TonB-dependent receptor [uncultured Draconibacterium sp.]